MTTKSTTVATYVASGGAMLFGLTANELAAIGGLTIAALTFLANLWFQWDRRQREIAAGVRE